MNGEMPADRLPVLEWAVWWDQTITRWHGEGLPDELDGWGIKRFFGLDMDYQWCFPNMLAGAPTPSGHGKARIETEADYDAALPFLYPDPAPLNENAARERARQQEAGDAIV